MRLYPTAQPVEPLGGGSACPVVNFMTIFESRLYRLTVRTEASQASNPGSIPGRVIKFYGAKFYDSK
ncbi:MAG: hypothetical protein UT17_C0011G0008 [Candidatus Woesebacteria bacterium GW2011_GWB1_39_10]|uniref:Uncharacterized protein n=1 Tax=Candidatus Woesebacteria bacterium GW2011_GWB1_39_10 TaxID=1618572 RepID=A0A0G0LHI6_9BACT|nr:MAG: hypothetical protein UT17_C0011G0008 [Candidatus Woesebacteria bacterium GW2011_GWB1_39_10]